MRFPSNLLIKTSFSKIGFAMIEIEQILLVTVSRNHCYVFVSVNLSSFYDVIIFAEIAILE